MPSSCQNRSYQQVVSFLVWERTESTGVQCRFKSVRLSECACIHPSHFRPARETPNFSPKITSVSGAKNGPKTGSMQLQSLLFCYLDERGLVFSKACNQGASRLGEAKPTLPKMGTPRTTAFRFGKGHSEVFFNVYFNSRRDQKRARQIHTLERVATCFCGLRHDARKASCFKSSPETTPQKAGRMTQTSKHGLRSHRNYYMPSNLAEAMIRLLDDSSNEGLTLLNQTLRKGEHVLGSMWTEQLSPADEQDLDCEPSPSWLKGTI